MLCSSSAAALFFFRALFASMAGSQYGQLPTLLRLITLSFLAASCLVTSDKNPFQGWIYGRATFYGVGVWGGWGVPVLVR